MGNHWMSEENQARHDRRSDAGVSPFGLETKIIFSTYFEWKHYTCGPQKPYFYTHAPNVSTCLKDWNLTQFQHAAMCMPSLSWYCALSHCLLDNSKVPALWSEKQSSQPSAHWIAPMAVAVFKCWRDPERPIGASESFSEICIYDKTNIALSEFGYRFIYIHSVAPQRRRRGLITPALFNLWLRLFSVSTTQVWPFPTQATNICCGLRQILNMCMTQEC